MTGRFFQDERAIVETECVGAGTRIWAFAHVLPGARIGAECNICDHTFLENDVVLGDRVTVKSGVQLWDGVELEDDVFIGPNATFTNDPLPRSKHHLAPGQRPRTLVKRGASIGANSTILPGIVIGEEAVVGAGAVVTHNVPPRAIVAGNPARITGYTDTPHPAAVGGPEAESGDSPALHARETEVRGVTLYRLPQAEDMRGALTFAEIPQNVPFEVKRLFLVYNVPSREVRGEHAHRTLHQFLICVHGSCSVVADDGAASREFTLDAPGLALHIPPMVWSLQHKHSPDAVLLVLASAPYDPADYIREYDEFKRLLAANA